MPRKKLNPTQQKKFQRYKKMWGIGEYTAYKGALGDKFALEKIKNRKKTKAYKKYY